MLFVRCMYGMRFVYVVVGSIVKRGAVGRLARVYYGRVGLGDYDWWCKA